MLEKPVGLKEEDEARLLCFRQWNRGFGDTGHFDAGGVRDHGLDALAGQFQDGSRSPSKS